MSTDSPRTQRGHGSSTSPKVAALASTPPPSAASPSPTPASASASASASTSSGAAIDAVRSGWLTKDGRRYWAELYAGKLVLRHEKGGDSARSYRIDDRTVLRDAQQQPNAFALGSRVFSAESTTERALWTESIHDTLLLRSDPTYTSKPTVGAVGSVVVGAAAVSSAGNGGEGEDGDDDALGLGHLDSAFDTFVAAAAPAASTQQHPRTGSTATQPPATQPLPLSASWSASAAATDTATESSPHSSLMSGSRGVALAMASGSSSSANAQEPAGAVIADAIAAAIASHGSSLSDEARICSMAQTDAPLNGQVALYQDAFVAVTRYRVILFRGARKPRIVGDFHIYEIDGITVTFRTNTIAFAVRPSSDGGDSHSGSGGGSGGSGGSGNSGPTVTLSVCVPAPTMVLEELLKSMRCILPRSKWPAIRGLPSGYALTDESSVPAKLSPVQLYLAQCSLASRSASVPFVHHLRRLEQEGSTDLDLNRAPTANDDDVSATVAFLAHDTHFRSLSLVNSARKEVFLAAASVVRANAHLSRLVLRGVGADERQVTELVEALKQSAPVHSLCVIDISGSPIRDAGRLAVALDRIPHSVVSLSLAGCGLQPKGFQMLFEALRRNMGMSLAIEQLDVSRNRLDDSGTVALDEWLSESASNSRLRTLSVAGSKASLGLLFALERLPNLAELDTGGNRIDPAAALVLSHTAQRQITHLCLAGCTVAKKSALACVVSAFLANPRRISLDLTNLELKRGSSGHFTKALVDAPSPLSSLTRLCISGIPLTSSQFTSIASALCQPSSPSARIERLLADRPQKESIEGNEGEWASALCAIVRGCSTLQHLSISGGYGPKVIIPFAESLVKNISLKSLLVNDNNLGEHGMSALAEMLRANCCLATLYCDHNGASTSGIQALCSALAVNESITALDLHDDIAKASAASPEIFACVVALSARLFVNASRHPGGPPNAGRVCEDPVGWFNARYAVDPPIGQQLSWQPRQPPPPPVVVPSPITRAASFRFASLFSGAAAAVAVAPNDELSPPLMPHLADSRPASAASSTSSPGNSPGLVPKK